MKDKLSKLVFYKLKKSEEKIDLTEIKNEENKLNGALTDIINKDIKRLSRNLKNDIKEINDALLENNIFFEKELSMDIEDVNNTVENIKKLKKIVMKKKKRVKPGFLTLNKKRKQQNYNNILNLESVIKIKEKSIILLRDEYNKLNKKLKDTTCLNIKEPKENEEDMLERTISFYMNKN